MRRVAGVAASVALCAAALAAGYVPAAADVLVNVSKTSQRVSVLVDGSQKYNWLVTTGAKRFTTPSGVYKPQWMARKWKSKQYNNAPMPYSIFFHQGYALHGTTDIARLGRIGSHGCVRLHPDNAEKLYSLVQKNMENTRIVVSDDVIEKPGEPPKKKRNNQYVADNAAEEVPAGGGKLETVALLSKGGLSAYAFAVDTPAIKTVDSPAMKKVDSPAIKTVDSPAIKTIDSPAIKTIDLATGVRIEMNAKADRTEKAVAAEKAKPQREARVRDNRPGFHW